MQLSDLADLIGEYGPFVRGGMTISGPYGARLVASALRYDEQWREYWQEHGFGRVR